MSTLTTDIYDQPFDLEKVHPGTCLSVDDGDWFVFRTFGRWIDERGGSWTSEDLVDYVEGGGGYPRFKRLN